MILCDADDVSSINRFNVVFSKFSDRLLDGYGHAAKIIDAKGLVVSECYMQNKLLRLLGLNEEVHLYELHGACLAVKGKFVLELPAPTHRELFQDVFFAFFASMNKSKFLIESKRLILYRRHSTANSNCGNQNDYSGFFVDQEKSRDNCLRLYNLHVWFEWYVEMSESMQKCPTAINLHLKNLKEMHFLKYNFGNLKFFGKVRIFFVAIVSKSPAWKWFLYRIFGLKLYYLLLSLRAVFK